MEHILKLFIAQIFVSALHRVLYQLCSVDASVSVAVSSVQEYIAQCEVDWVL